MFSLIFTQATIISIFSAVNAQTNITGQNVTSQGGAQNANDPTVQYTIDLQCLNAKIYFCELERKWSISHNTCEQEQTPGCDGLEGVTFYESGVNQGKPKEINWSGRFNDDLIRNLNEARIGFISDLTHLDLSSNAFRGKIPQTIRHLANLEHL